MTDEHIYITPAILAVHAIERAAIEVEAALNAKSDRWWFAITDAHYEASRTNPDAQSLKEGYILPFEDLLKRAQDDIGSTLTLTDQCKKDLRLLNQFRNELHHVKPQRWYLETDGLSRILGGAAEAMHQLFKVH
jgi:hypothetical protein